MASLIAMNIKREQIVDTIFIILAWLFTISIVTGGYFKNQIVSPLKNITNMTIILIITGLLGFAIFFKSIDFFDKI